MNRYILLTSAKNEEGYIQKTIETVLGQSIMPLSWIIVDDHSNDNTAKIIQNIAKEYPFIQYALSRNDNKGRSFQAKVNNLNYALSLINTNSYDFIGTIDTDIELPNTYYETMMNSMRNDRSLGLAGGWITEESDGKFLPRKGNRTSYVPGAIQFFKRECFEQIAQFPALPYGGYDTFVNNLTLMHGWRTHSFKNLPIKHLRETSGSSLTGKIRSGRKDYTVGYPSLYAIGKSVIRLLHKPLIIGSCCYLYGFFSEFTKKNNHISKELNQYLKAEYRKKILRRISLWSK